MEKLQIVKLATDMIHNRVSGNFADASKNSEALIDALIEANGGSTKINPKTFHRGNALFDIVEEIIPTITEEGLTGDEFFMELVEYRNLAEGDQQEFVLEDKSEFVVADAAHGTQGIRRQRLDAGESLKLTPQMKVVKVYEELRRLLAKRVDFNTFITKVGKAMVQEFRNDIYTAFNGITSSTIGLNSNYVITGTYSEANLLTLIEHVEAANPGKTAKIVGTKTALRKVTTATVSDEAKSDMYNVGYYGKFNGTAMIMVKQAHKLGTDTFVLDDTKIYVIASDDKPIKAVNEGVAYISAPDPMSNADMTQDYFVGQAWAVAVLANDKLGVLSV